MVPLSHWGCITVNKASMKSNINNIEQVTIDIDNDKDHDNDDDDDNVE